MTKSDTGWDQRREAVFQALMKRWRMLEDRPRERLARARDLLEYTRRQLQQPGWAASFGVMSKGYDALHEALKAAVEAANADKPRPPLFDPVAQDAQEPNRARH